MDGEVADMVAGELAPEVVDLDSLVDDDGLEDMEADSEGYSGDCLFSLVWILEVLCLFSFSCFVIFRI